MARKPSGSPFRLESNTSVETKLPVTSALLRQRNIACSVVYQKFSGRIAEILRNFSNFPELQALLANMSAMYAVYHGPKRLLEIARAIHKSTAFLESGSPQGQLHSYFFAKYYRFFPELLKAGHHTAHKNYFDTLKVTVKDLAAFKQRAEERHMNFRQELYSHLIVMCASTKIFIDYDCSFFDDGSVGVSLDEATKPSDLLDLLYVFNGSTKLTEVKFFIV